MLTKTTGYILCCFTGLPPLSFIIKFLNMRHFVRKDYVTVYVPERNILGRIFRVGTNKIND